MRKMHLDETVLHCKHSYHFQYNFNQKQFEVLYSCAAARCTLVVEALGYKPEGRGFGTRLGEWIFFNLPNPSSRIRPWGLLSL
jgi:hypothetical protein